MRFLVGLLVMCVPLTVFGQTVPCSLGPLSEQALSHLISGKVAESRIVSLITACGITFQVDAATEGRLKRAGATQPVLTAVRERALKPKASSPVQPATRTRPNKSVTSPASPALPAEVPSDVTLRAEVELWNTIKEMNNVELFEDYARRYPQGQFIAPARMKIRDFTGTVHRVQIQKALSDRRWDDAENSLTSLSKVVPENEEIRAWMKSISDGRAEDAERKHWSGIESRTDVIAFEEFLNKYPRGQFAPSARAKITDLKAASAVEMFRPRIQQAILDRRWDDAESNISQLTKVVLENDEIQNWRRTISLGRTRDRAAADDVKFETPRAPVITNSDRTPATVWVYRTRNNMLSDRWADPTFYFCGGEKLARVAKNEFFAVSLPQGKHCLTVDGPNGVAFWVLVEWGEHAFVKDLWFKEILGTADSDQAAKDFGNKELKPVQSKNVFSPKVLTTAPFK